MAKVKLPIYQRTQLIGGDFGTGDPYWDNVSLLQSFYDNTEVDLSTYGHTVNFFGNAVLDSTQARFPSGPHGGMSSLSIPATGSNSYAEIPSHASLTLGTNDFTIEFWVWFDSFIGSGQWQGLYDQRTTPTQVRPAIYISSTETLNYYVNGAVRITGPATSELSTSTWYHIAVCRGSGTTRMFVDGSQVGSNYTDSNNYSQERVRIGGLGNDTGFPARGWIDGVRTTVGTARYTENFTPPKAPYPNYKKRVKLPSDVAGDTFDSSNLGTKVSLLNNDLTATNVIGNVSGIARTNVGRSTGKYYFEFDWALALSGTATVACGVASSTMSVNDSTYTSNLSWTMWGTNTGARHNGSTTVASTSSITERYGFAVDLDGGKLWIWDEGANDWLQGDPETDSSPIWSNLSGTIHPIAQPWSPGTGVEITLHSTASSLNRSVPSGYTAGWPA